MRLRIWMVSAILLLGSMWIHAQHDLSSYNLPVWQATKLNPAKFTDDTWTVALPGIYYNMVQDGPRFGKLFQEVSDGTIIDFDYMLGEINGENQIRGDVEISSLHIAYRMKDFNFSLGHNWKMLGGLSYDDDLIKLVAGGNAQFIGETVSIGPGLQLSTYHEFVLGLGYRKSGFSAGANVKFLSGIEHVGTTKESMEVYTSDDIYQLEFTNDYALQSSGVFDFQSITDVNFNFSGVSYKNMNFANPGVAIDLGLAYKTDQFEVSASLLDLGGITWNTDAKTFTSNSSNTYEGIDLIDLFSDSLNVFDSLSNILAFESTEESFRTSLPVKFYLNGSYNLNDWTLGATFYGERFRCAFTPAFALYAQRTFSEKYTLGLQYAYRNGKAFNVGLHMSLNLGPIQVFAATDNLLTAFTPTSGAVANGRIGINYIFNSSQQ